MTDTTTTQQTQQQDRPAAQRSAREVIREHVAAVNGWCDAWGYASIQNAADFYLLDPDVRVVMRTALALRALLDAPGEVECSDATARDETNRQLREAQRLLDEEIRTAETWRDRCFKVEKDRDGMKAVRQEDAERLSEAFRDRDEARKALADERAAHEATKRALKEANDLVFEAQTHTLAAKCGNVSDRARLIYEGAVRLAASDLVDADADEPRPWLVDDACVEEKRDKTLVAYARAAHDLLAACERKTLRAAEAEAAKGASGEGKA